MRQARMWAAVMMVWGLCAQGAQTLVVPDDFSAGQVIALLGLEKTHPLVRGVVEARKLKEYTKGPSGEFNGAGVSMIYSQNVIDRVIFNCADSKDPEEKAFGGEWPAGIVRGATPEELIKKFGKPVRETRDKERGVDLEWKDVIKGTEMEVSWDKEGKMREIWVDLPWGEEKAKAAVPAKVVEGAAARVKKVLPKGWEVKVEGAGMTVSRTKGVEMEVFDEVANMSGGEGVGGAATAPAGRTFDFTLKVAEGVTREEYVKRVRRADELRTEAEKISAEDAGEKAEKDPEKLPNFDSAEHAKLMRPYAMRKEAREMTRELPAYWFAEAGVLWGVVYRNWNDNESPARFKKAEEEDECRGVETMVVGSFDSCMSTEKSDKIVHELLGKLEKFSMVLEYHGTREDAGKDRPMSLIVDTAKLDMELKADWAREQINEFQAARLIEMLRNTGALETMREVRAKNVAAPKGPAYTLRVTVGEGEWYGELGWKGGLIQLLDLDGHFFGETVLSKTIAPMRAGLGELLKEYPTSMRAPE